MRIFSILLFLCLISISLSACLTLPSTFTNENIMKVRQGMSSDEILEMFGEPKNIDIRVLGAPPHHLTYTTWEYGEYPYERARFTFTGEHDSLILNDFNVDRD